MEKEAADSTELDVEVVKTDANSLQAQNEQMNDDDDDDKRVEISAAKETSNDDSKAILMEATASTEEMIHSPEKVNNEPKETLEKDKLIEIADNLSCENIEMAGVENESTQEKCVDEPMDIDEILNSLNTDTEATTSSESGDVGSAQTKADTTETSQLPNLESEGDGGEEGVVVLLSDGENGIWYILYGKFIF